MAAGLPLHRFEEFSALSADERSSVVKLVEPPRRLDANVTIRDQDEDSDGFFLLLDGWATASILLSDGSRQILKVHLPGDALGTPSMSVTRSVEVLTTITPALVAKVPYDRFAALFDDHPRVAACFLLSVQRERVALMDQLTSMGRTSAESRLAALFLDLLERAIPIGLVERDSFFLPLTQIQIADVLGLTNVHVNRMIRDLRERGIAAHRDRRLTIMDRNALEAIAARPPRTLHRDAAWLPARRTRG